MVNEAGMHYPESAAQQKFYLLASSFMYLWLK